MRNQPTLLKPNPPDSREASRYLVHQVTPYVVVVIADSTGHFGSSEKIRFAVRVPLSTAALCTRAFTRPINKWLSLPSSILFS